MRHRLLLPEGSASSAWPPAGWPDRRARHAITAGAVVAGLAAAGLAPAATSTAGPRAPQPVSVTPVRGATEATVPLITGGQVMVTTTPGGQRSYTLRPLAGSGGAAVWYQAPAGEQYIIPAVAVPYAGRELGRSLFDVSALARDGITGSTPIPVSLSFAPGATVAAPPGVTLTSASRHSARGYLTAASGRLFAAALRKQTAAGTTHGHLASTGRLFGGLTAMNLAAPGTPLAPRPDYPLHILQLNVTDYAGQPASNAQLVLANTDDLRRELTFVPIVDGVGRIAVPAGDYFVSAAFIDSGAKAKPTAFRQVTLNDFRVPATSAVTSVAVDERTATSAISASTPRPATAEEEDALAYRVSAAGTGFATGLINIYASAIPTYVNAQPAAKVGRLRYLLRWSGAPPAGTYRYDAAFAFADIPASEHFVVRASQIATVHEHFSADPASGPAPGYWSDDPYDATSIAPRSRSPFPLLALSTGFPQTMPGNLTQYIGTAAGDQWVQADDTSNGTYLIADPRTFAARHHYSTAWAHGPSAPGLGQHTGPWICQACTADHTLSLVFSPLGDSVPDHESPAWNFFGPPRPHYTPPSAHFTLYRDGTKLFSASRALGAVVRNARPGSYRAVLDVNLAGQPGFSQSTRTHTNLRVRYAPGTGAVLPAKDTCPGRTASTPCRILPALTLNYRLATDESNTSSSQVQVLHLRVGHVSYDGAGSNAAIRSAAVWVSFNGGRSWRRAAITGSAGRYTATWPNPAPTRGTRPQIKVAAADAVSGSITQTITDAYTTGTISHSRSSR